MNASRTAVAAMFATASLLACDPGSVDDVANLDLPGSGGPATQDPAAPTQDPAAATQDPAAPAQDPAAATQDPVAPAATPVAPGATASQVVTSWAPDRGAGAIIDLGGGWYQTNHETFRAYTEGQGTEGYLDFVWDGRTPNDSGLGTEDVTIRLGPNDMNELNIGLWFTKSAWFEEGRLVVQQKYNPEDLGLSWWQAPPDGVWSQGYTYLGGTPVQIQQGQQYQLGYRINGNQLDVLLNGQSIWTCTIPPESMQYVIGTDTNIRSDNAIVRYSYRMVVPQQTTVALTQ